MVSIVTWQSSKTVILGWPRFKSCLDTCRNVGWKSLFLVNNTVEDYPMSLPKWLSTMISWERSVHSGLKPYKIVVVSYDFMRQVSNITKNIEKTYFEKHSYCTAPRSWSKYTTYNAQRWLLRTVSYITLKKNLKKAIEATKPGANPVKIFTPQDKFTNTS